MKKFCVVVVLAVAIIFLAGCWDAVEINDQAIIWGLGCDVGKDEKDKLLLTLAGPTTTEGAKEPFEKVSVEGYSFDQTLANAQSYVFKTIELGHLRVLIFGEDFAKKGIEKYMDPIVRNPRISRECNIVVLKGKAKDLFELKNPGDPMPSDYLVSLIDTNAGINHTMDINFRDFFEMLHTPGQEPLACYGRISEDKKDININALAAFRGDKMVGTIEGMEVSSLIILRNKNREGFITVGQASAGQNQHSMTMNYHSANTKVDAKLKGDKPYINVKILVEGDLVESTTKAPTMNREILKGAELQFSKALEGDVTRLIDKCQHKLKSDIIGFGQYYHAYYPKFVKKHTWSDVFPNAEIRVHVEVRIRRIGVES